MEPTAASPHMSATGRSSSTSIHRILDRALTIGAVALMLYGAFWPIFGELPGRGVQILTLIAVATTVVGGLAVPRGSRLAFTLLWVAFGMAAGIGTIGIFSVGFVYLIAAALLVLAAIATPNRSDIELRYDWRFVVGFHVGYLLMFFAFLV